MDDEAAVEAFRKRISPILGNLEEVHNHFEKALCPKMTNTPMLDLILQCWVPEDTKSGGDCVYELIDLVVSDEQ